MNSSYNILESIRPVIDNLKYIKINKSKIANILPYISDTPSKPWLTTEYLDIDNRSEEEKVRFLLLLDSLNFCFWGKGKWKVLFRDKEYSGSYGIVYALTRALEEGYNILDFEYVRTMPREDFETITRGTATQIPLFEERYDIVKNVAATVLDKFDGKAYELFLKANSDMELLKIIVDSFENFRDISMYNGKPVYLLKRASLLTDDLYRNVEQIRKNIKSIYNLEALPDYKIPQVLRDTGILEYNRELAALVDNQIEIEHDSVMEIEIRACTIEAVELIKQSLKEKGINRKARDIDTDLWLLSKRDEFKKHPHHLTKTIYY